MSHNPIFSERYGDSDLLSQMLGEPRTSRSRRPDLAFQEGDRRMTSYEHDPIPVVIELN